MKAVFLAPSYPPEMQQYTRGLAEVGVDVYGVGDQPAAALPAHLKRHLHDYLQVPRILDDDDVVARVHAWLRGRSVDRVLANWEVLVETAARLREKFGLPGKPLDRFSVALIVSVAHSEKTSGTEQAPERQKKLIGIMVDAVADVLSIDPEQVEPVPDLGSRVDTSFIKGMVRFQDRYLILLEVEKVVGEAAANDQAAAA